MKLLDFDRGNILYTMLTMLTILSQSNSVLQPELNYCKTKMTTYKTIQYYYSEG